MRLPDFRGLLRSHLQIVDLSFINDPIPTLINIQFVVIIHITPWLLPRREQPNPVTFLSQQLFGTRPEVDGGQN